jgi:hypothetical protein
MDDAVEPCGALRRRSQNSIGKPFCKDLPGAEHRVATEPSGDHQELRILPRQWQIVRPPVVAAMYTPRNRAARRAYSEFVGMADGDDGPACGGRAQRR